MVVGGIREGLYAAFRLAEDLVQRGLIEEVGLSGLDVQRPTQTVS